MRVLKSRQLPSTGVKWSQSAKLWYDSLWPHWPLAAAIGIVGILNILNGLRLPFEILLRIRAFGGIAKSLSALGGTIQVILGAMLVLAAAGIIFRMVSAWVLAVFLLFIAVGVGAIQERWGGTLIIQIVLLAAMLGTRRHFTRRTVLANILFSVGGVAAAMAYGVFGSYLMGAGFRPQIHDMDTALYFTITTLSTVGYGDIVPVTPEARWFAITLIIIGLGVFVSAIASAVGPKISGELNRLLNPRVKSMEPKDHVILVGEGIIAINTATELKQRGVVFVQIVTAKAEAETPGHQVIVGDATNDDILRAAGIQHARMVIAAREDDGENAFIALGAKDLNPNVRVMAVASSALSIRRLKLARADLVFSPAAVGSRLLADLVQGNEILPEFRDLLEGHPNRAPGK
jgi:voltage-gated potassium channel